MAKQKRMPTDLNQRAKAIVDFATSDEDDEERPKNEVRAASGRKGAAARAEKLTAEERSEIARRVARSRWARAEQA